jgi:hypothetical protein
VPDAPAPQPPYPTRFGWGMRLLLGVLLFDMFFRSFSTLYPWEEWAGELAMPGPRRLPTRAEMAASPDGGRAATAEALRALPAYFVPWPEEETRRRLVSPADAAKWGPAWLATRLGALERVVGINQEWPMFSPNVRKVRHLARARLRFADGSEQTVRMVSDPPDLTRYSHWFEEKVLDYEGLVSPGSGQNTNNFGYCNLLLHRHPRNAAGSPLRAVELYMVRYDAPPPGEGREWLRRQTGPPQGQVYPVFYVFDGTARHGKCLIERYDDE